MEETDVVSNPTFTYLRFFIPNFVFPIFERSIPSQPHSPLAWFDKVKKDAFLKVFHENVKEDKGKELAFGGFKPPPPMDAEDVEVNALHVIFYLKGVLVGKDSFIISHFLIPRFNLALGPTMQDHCTQASSKAIPP